MNRIAKFEKVSFEQFNKSLKELTGYSDSGELYEKIKLPQRATAGSAGYDFYSPVDFENNAGNEITVPSGIRCRMDKGWVLQCYPRSGLGFRYGMRLSNTVGIIDSDYYYSDNEGHIIFRISSSEKINISLGERFIQGIFLPYGITVDDNANAARNGGFGSSGRL